MSKAEEKVKRLARLKSNCTCANCGNFNKFGFNTVCIKFHTFVCNECKASHQAISHRCKSLTMSSWTHEEVQELELKGNDHARQTWLMNAPPCGQGGRPKPGMELSVYKRFVVECYEHKRYYGTAKANNEAVVAGVTPVVTMAAETVTASVRIKNKSPRKPQAPPPTTELDLLDFGDPEPISAPALASNVDFFNADFGDFSSPQAAPSKAPNVDLFGADVDATPTASHATSISFDPFSSSGNKTVNMVTPGVSGNNSVVTSMDEMFGDFTVFQPVPAPAIMSTNSPQAKKPIMGGHQNASKISMMGAPSLDQPFANGTAINLQQQQMRILQQMQNMTLQQKQQHMLRIQQQNGMQMNLGINACNTSHTAYTANNNFTASNVFSTSNNAFTGINNAFTGSNNAFTGNNNSFTGNNNAFSTNNNAFSTNKNAFHHHSKTFVAHNNAFANSTDPFSSIGNLTVGQEKRF